MHGFGARLGFPRRIASNPHTSLAATTHARLISGAPRDDAPRQSATANLSLLTIRRPGQAGTAPCHDFVGQCAGAHKELFTRSNPKSRAQPNSRRWNLGSFCQKLKFDCLYILHQLQCYSGAGQPQEPAPP